LNIPILKAYNLNLKGGIAMSNIFFNTPVLLLVIIFSSLSIGFTLRLYFEGGSFGTAIKSYLFVFVLPIVYYFFLIKVFEEKRSLIYNFKSDPDFTDKKLKKLESLLKSKTFFTVIFLFKLITHFRLFVHLYVRFSVEYSEKMKKKERVRDYKKNEADKFFNQLLDKMNINKHIFS
jgi:hypothetical protein